MFYNDLEKENRYDMYQLDFENLVTILNERMEGREGEDKKSSLYSLLRELYPGENLDFEKLASEFYNELYAYSVLTPYFKMGEEHLITDLFIDAYDEIYYRQGGEIVETNARFFNERHYKKFIEKFVDTTNSSLNKASKKLEATFESGARLSGQHPAININGYAIAIRFKSSKVFTPSDYVKFGSGTFEMFDFLEKVLASGARIMIHGITGAGKTSLLETLITLYPKTVSGKSLHRHGFITDTEILYLKKRAPYLRVLENNSLEGFTLSDAVKNVLRMDVKKLHFNEVRDEAVYEVFKGWTTGLDGVSGCFGEDFMDAYQGIASHLVSANPRCKPYRMIDSAVDLFIEVKTLRKKKVVYAIRQLVEVLPDGTPVIEDLFLYDKEEDKFISYLDKVSLSKKIAKKMKKEEINL